MSHEVLVTERAERELNQAANWIAETAPETAERWFNGFVQSILTLSSNPERCSLAAENKSFPFELRQLLYGRRRSHRALFTIRKKSVIILSIRHVKQKELSPDDLLG